MFGFTECVKSNRFLENRNGSPSLAWASYKVNYFEIEFCNYIIKAIITLLIPLHLQGCNAGHRAQCRNKFCSSYRATCSATGNAFQRVHNFYAFVQTVKQNLYF